MDNLLDRIAQQQALARAKVPELVAFLEAMKIAFPSGEGHLYKRAPERKAVSMDKMLQAAKWNLMVNSSKQRARKYGD